MNANTHKLLSNIKLDEVLYKKLCPADYLSGLLRETQRRSDGRTIADARPLKIEHGTVTTADSSAMVRLGNTLVVCGVRCEVAEWAASAPNAGFFVVNADVSPLCSAAYAAIDGPQQASDASQRISSQLAAVFERCIDTQQLAICPEQRLVWAIYADVTCCNDDGACFSASCIALTAALSRLQLRPVSQNSEGLVVWEEDNGNPNSKPLILNHFPVALSFGVFAGQLLIDVTDFEEANANLSGHICICSKSNAILGFTTVARTVAEPISSSAEDSVDTTQLLRRFHDPTQLIPAVFEAAVAFVSKINHNLSFL